MEYTKPSQANILLCAILTKQPAHYNGVKMSLVSQEPTLASIPESPTLNDMESRSM